MSLRLNRILNQNSGDARIYQTTHHQCSFQHANLYSVTFWALEQVPQRPFHTLYLLAIETSILPGPYRGARSGSRYMLKR